MLGGCFCLSSFKIDRLISSKSWDSCLSRISCAVGHFGEGQSRTPSFLFLLRQTPPSSGPFKDAVRGRHAKCVQYNCYCNSFSRACTDREPVFSERSASFGVAFTSKDGVYLALNATLAAHRRFDASLDPSAQESTASTNSGSRDPRLTPNTPCLLPLLVNEFFIFYFPIVMMLS